MSQRLSLDATAARPVAITQCECPNAKCHRHTDTQTHRHTDTDTHTHTNTHTHTHHTNTHTYTHTHTHTHTRTYISSLDNILSLKTTEYKYISLVAITTESWKWSEEFTKQ